MELTGFKRGDGRYGIRNLVAVMAASDNVNPLARRLAMEMPGVVCLPASYGRGQLGDDLGLTLRTMAGLATHPNLFGCLIVCFEPEIGRRLQALSENLNRRCEILSLLEEGGLTSSLGRGVAIVTDMLTKREEERRRPMDLRHFLIGSECGGSDATSGLISNPALGRTVDQVVDLGGAAIFSEPVECLGCELILEERARDPKVARDAIATVEKYRRVALDQGVDLTGVNPTSDNMAGGLSTIEEKSLGALTKSGSRTIEGVLAYGQRPAGAGLWFMDAPAAAVENLTALAAAGCQAILFSTGNGNPVGYPLSPTIKVCGNPQTVKYLAEHIDVDLSGGLGGAIDLEGCGRKVFNALLEVMKGLSTAAEKLDYLTTNISRIGLSV